MKSGEVVAEGTPEAVAKTPRSFTGRYLAPLLARGGVKERVAAEYRSSPIAAYAPMARGFCFGL